MFEREHILFLSRRRPSDVPVNHAAVLNRGEANTRAAIIEAANARGATSGESIVDRKIELMAEWQAIVEELNYDKDALAERLYERVFSQLPF